MIQNDEQKCTFHIYYLQYFFLWFLLFDLLLDLLTKLKSVFNFATQVYLLAIIIYMIWIKRQCDWQLRTLQNKLSGFSSVLKDVEVGISIWWQGTCVPSHKQARALKRDETDKCMGRWERTNLYAPACLFSQHNNTNNLL